MLASGGSASLGGTSLRTGYSKSSLSAMICWPVVLSRKLMNFSAFCRSLLDSSRAAPEMLTTAPTSVRREVVERAVHALVAELEPQAIPVVLS